VVGVGAVAVAVVAVVVVVVARAGPRSVEVTTVAGTAELGVEGAAVVSEVAGADVRTGS